MGFKGVIVSDAIGMAAILKKWPLPQACAMAIKAGVDTILLKADDESRSQCFFGIKSAVERGELSEERLNDAVRRLLCMKYDQGLFEKAGKMDPEKTTAIVRSKEVHGLLAGKWRTRPSWWCATTRSCCPSARTRRSWSSSSSSRTPSWARISTAIRTCSASRWPSTRSTSSWMTPGFHATDEEVEEALKLAKEADLVVMTNYYARIEKRGNNQHLVKALKAAGHTVVVVTNFPYLKGTTKEADAVVCNFSGSPDSIRVAADLLFGAVKPCPTTKMPIDLSAEKNLPVQEPAAPPKKPAKKPAGKQGNVWGGKC